MKSEQKVSILFVCMGNICRSPTAEGVFRHVVDEAGLADIGMKMKRFKIWSGAVVVALRWLMNPETSMRRFWGWITVRKAARS